MCFTSNFYLEKKPERIQHFNLSHLVILNLFQDLKGILKQVPNDSERQNGLD